MKKIMITALIIISLFIIYFVGTGFTKSTSVYINDFYLSEDGKEITINVGVASSIGYVRDVSVHKKDDGNMYIDFYSAFGGINGNIGAKNEFTLSLSEKTSNIAVFRDGNHYEVFLQKNEDGSWHRVTP